MVDDDAKSRLRRMIGEDGIARLDEAVVAVFGLGGVGSNCAEALVRGGVGTLVFVDRDVVAPSNVNRQSIAFTSTVGRPKAEVMAAMAHEINPDARIFARTAFVRDDVAAVLEGAPRPSYIVDAFDTVAVKVLLATYAQAEGIPIISSMGSANKLDPMMLRFTDLFETENCPLCRSMRKVARARGLTELPVLYSCEHPVPVRAEEGASRRERTELGTMSYMPAVMGQMIAGYVIRRLLGCDQQMSARDEG